VTGETLLVMPTTVGVLDVLCASDDERAEISAQSTDEVALAYARLLAPIVPATLRDFSAFEQHVEGAVMVSGGPSAEIFRAVDRNAGREARGSPRAT
jgi:hypothetical protein